MPGWVLGPEALTPSKTLAFRGSNVILSFLFLDLDISPFLGLPAGAHAPLLSETVHLRDVVEAHVNALSLERINDRYRNFLLCSDQPTGPVFMDAIDVLKGNMAPEVAEGRIPFTGRLGKLGNPRS